MDNKLIGKGKGTKGYVSIIYITQNGEALLPISISGPIRNLDAQIGTFVSQDAYQNYLQQQGFIKPGQRIKKIMLGYCAKGENRYLDVLYQDDYQRFNKMLEAIEKKLYYPNEYESATIFSIICDTFPNVDLQTLNEVFIEPRVIYRPRLQTLASSVIIAKQNNEPYLDILEQILDGLLYNRPQPKDPYHQPHPRIKYSEIRRLYTLLQANKLPQKEPIQLTIPDDTPAQLKPTSGPSIDQCREEIRRILEMDSPQKPKDNPKGKSR